MIKYLEYAIELGLNKIAFTDHVRISTKWLKKYIKEINYIKKEYSSIEIYSGIESKPVDIYTTHIDAPLWVYKEIDLILFSIHQRLPTSIPFSFISAKSLTPNQVASIEKKATINALRNLPKIDIISHPTKMFYKIFPNEIFPYDYLMEIVKEVKKVNVAIEINGKHLCTYKYPIDLINILYEINPLVSYGSDSHKPEDLGQGLTRLNELMQKIDRKY